GSELVSRALAWFREGHAQRIRVSVADGNEAAFAFYRKFGFFPRMTVLEQKNG
ncbi:N-acetyltransferase, partial [Methanoregula sp.]|uniref:GNAT family N-acetyltransferase n=1 Tax=Methanoregula sp. TaxID=2052170 RepID=UPI000CC29770